MSARQSTIVIAASIPQYSRPGPAGFSGAGSRHAERAARWSSGFMGRVKISMDDSHGGSHPALCPETDRKSVVEGKSVSVRVDLGGRRSIKNKTKNTTQTQSECKKKN